jgi:hypothetical protein
MKRALFPGRWTATVLGLLMLAGIGVSRLYGYLLFHSLAELLGISIAIGIFMIAWHSRGIADIPYFLFLGIAGLCVAGIDLLHTLGYTGMGVFKGATSNLPTQLWIAARSVESLVFFFAPLFIGKKPKPQILLLGAAVVFSGLVLMIFQTDLFPVCWVEGSGLTSFKKISEYLISAVFLSAIAHLVFRRKAFDPGLMRLVVAALALKLLSELAFTLYAGVYDVFNLSGHLLRIVAAALIYLGIIRTGFEKPYRLLFRDLKQRETQLEEAIEQVKTLRGFLPICSSCKKVRNDAGYWQQIESYVTAHSEAEFTHSLCPDCARKLYPGFTDDEPKEPE